MLIPPSILSLVSIGLIALVASSVSGQNYPIKPIRIVTSGIGGNTDLQSRIFAPLISGPLGQPVIIDNRSSGAELVSQAPPDGYLLYFSGASLWIGPLLRDAPYNVERDFAPITVTASSPAILVVHPSLPVRSVKELIALAKVKPGELNLTSGEPGGSAYLAGELFKAMAGVNIVRIPYQSGSMEMADLIGGHVQLTFSTPGTARSYINAGRLRALAVSSINPSALFPGLPTVAASVPGFEYIAVNAIFAPAKTPATIISKLNHEMARAINSAEVKQKFYDVGVEPLGNSPEEAQKFLKNEITKWAKTLKNAGFKKSSS